MDIFTTAAMIGVLQSPRFGRPSRFLLDTFFPDIRVSDAQEIKFDVMMDDLKIAPFVSPLVPAKAMGFEGYRTDTFTPAYLKPKHQLSPQGAGYRLPGEPIGGNLSRDQRRARRLAETLQLQQDYIIRRKEVMASEVLRLGQQTVSGEQYQTRVVTFDRDSGHSISLTSTARWGESGVSPLANMQTWADTIADKVGAAPNVSVMDALSWGFVRADPNYEKLFDPAKGGGNGVEAGQSGIVAAMPGTPIYRGRLGQLSVFTYNDTYKDEAGATQKLLPDYTVIMGATDAAEGKQLQGAILDEDVSDVPQSFEIFPKSWVEKDPGIRWVLSQSAPLVVPGRANATLRATVR